MSRVLKGWREIAEMTPFSEETVRKRLKPGMVGARAVFRSKLGKSKRWTYWSTESLITRYLIALADNNNGEI
jgi:hypothetical protein